MGKGILLLCAKAVEVTQALGAVEGVASTAEGKRPFPRPRLLAEEGEPDAWLRLVSPFLNYPGHLRAETEP